MMKRRTHTKDSTRIGTETETNPNGGRVGAVGVGEGVTGGVTGEDTGGGTRGVANGGGGGEGGGGGTGTIFEGLPVVVVVVTAVVGVGAPPIS